MRGRGGAGTAGLIARKAGGIRGGAGMASRRRGTQCSCGKVPSVGYDMSLGDRGYIRPIEGLNLTHKPSLWNGTAAPARLLPLRAPALKSCLASRTYYDRKRTEGKTHIQAMLSLARRRMNVPWAMPRNGSAYTPVPAMAPPLAA